MSTTRYPNRDALRDAHDIYLDALRPLIYQRLRQIPGKAVEELIEDALRNSKEPNRFWEQFGKTGDVEASIDFCHLPHIINIYWDKVFKQPFGDDICIRNTSWVIRDGRNTCEHRGKEDLDPEFVRAHLFLIADILERMNKRSDKEAVDQLREARFADDTPKQLAKAEKDLAAAKSDNAQLTRSLKTATTEKDRIESSLKKARAEAGSANRRLATASKRLKSAESEKGDYKRRLEMTDRKLVSLKAELAEAKAPKPPVENPIQTLAREMETSPKKVKKALRAVSRKKSKKAVKRASGLKVKALQRSPAFSAAQAFYEAEHTSKKGDSVKAKNGIPQTHANGKSGTNPIKALAKELDTSYNTVQKAFAALYRRASQKDVERLTGLKVMDLRLATAYPNAWRFYKATRASDA